MGSVIARVWSGATRAEDVEAYAAYLEETGMRAARALEGSRGTLVLRRVEGGRADRFLVQRDFGVRDYEVEMNLT
jgi:hypothetical protein